MTLALNTSFHGGASNGYIGSSNLSPTTSNPAKLVNLELASVSKLPKVKPPTPPPRTTSDPSYSSDSATMDSGIGMTTDIPISVTHFSTAPNGFGLEKETIFTDGSEDPVSKLDHLDPASIVRKHLTNPFLTPEVILESAENPFTGKFNTIGRSNPFSTPNRSRNPFLDNTTATSDSPDQLTNGNSESETPKPESASPDASIDPTPILTPTPLIDELSKPTLNKIVSISMSCVGCAIMGLRQRYWSWMIVCCVFTSHENFFNL